VALISPDGDDWQRLRVCRQQYSKIRRLITVSNGATAGFWRQHLYNNKLVNVSGAGMHGQGAVYNSNNTYPAEVVNFTLTGDTKFGGSSAGI